MAETASNLPADLTMRKSDLSDTLSALEELSNEAQNSSLDLGCIEGQTINLAQNLIVQVFRLITDAGHKWEAPHITTEGEGEISFEWWRIEKVLTIFVNPDSTIEYLQAWGPQIWEQMDEGSEPSDAKLIELWQWLQA